METRKSHRHSHRKKVLPEIYLTRLLSTKVDARKKIFPVICMKMFYLFKSTFDGEEIVGKNIRSSVNLWSKTSCMAAFFSSSSSGNSSEVLG